MTRIVSMMAFLFLMAALVAAQDVPKVINGGVLNGKAVKLPKPKYPDEAKAAKLEGAVRIKVTIDEEGNVISAELSSEPYEVLRDGSRVKADPENVDPLLVEAAREAALEAKFSPTRLAGVPVKVSGTLTYNFVSSIETSSRSRADINGGLLNGKAIELPAPTYPEAARAVRASGTVAVEIVIDENGDVVSATAISGHPLLRSSATEAAQGAKFQPTSLEGKPIRVTGVLTYNFVLPDPNHD